MSLEPSWQLPATRQDEAPTSKRGFFFQWLGASMSKECLIVHLPSGKWCWEQVYAGGSTVVGLFDKRKDCEESAHSRGLIVIDRERRVNPREEDD